MSDALRALMAKYAEVDARIDALGAERESVNRGLNAIAFEIRDEIDRVVDCDRVIAWFDLLGYFAAEITLPRGGGIVVRGEYRDCMELRFGWMLVAEDVPSKGWAIPLAPTDPDPRYARDPEGDLRSTKLAQDRVGSETLERLAEIDAKFAFCMLPKNRAPANYARVRERKVAEEKTELYFGGDLAEEKT